MLRMKAIGTWLTPSSNIYRTLPAARGIKNDNGSWAMGCCSNDLWPAIVRIFCILTVRLGFFVFLELGDRFFVQARGLGNERDIHVFE